MNHNYADIRSRISDPPLWWDENAVPRYDPFEPRMLANIYAVECALIEIACQACGTLFDVAWSRNDHVFVGMRVEASKPLDPRVFHYGDPPNVGCCAAGPTMSSEPKRVLQSWRRDSGQWVRQPEKEVEIVE